MAISGYPRSAFLRRILRKTSKEAFPKNWRLCLLDSLAERGTGHTPNRDQLHYWNGGIKWLSLTDSRRLDKVFIGETDHNISEDGIAKSSAVKHPPGVVVLSRDAGVGKSAVTTCEMAVSQHFVVWRCGEELSNLYLYYWLQLMRTEFERIAVGSTIKTIGMPYFGKLAIAFPPREEQDRIANVLYSFDTAIDRIERLIVAKGRLKSGLVQQFLTQKRRFKEFESPAWKQFHLGELFAERNEINRTELLLLSITADRGVIPRDELDRKDSSSKDKSQYRRIAPGDIGYNTMRMWQGVSALSRFEGIVSPAYTIIIPNERIDGLFASYLFKFPPIVHLFRRYSQGMVDDTLSLKFPNFAQVKVTIPDITEQKRIAAVLFRLDHEIGLLRKFADLLEKQKKGLMQKLLSGQVRVKLPAATMVTTS